MLLTSNLIYMFTVGMFLGTLYVLIVCACVCMYVCMAAVSGGFNLAITAYFTN